MSSLNSIKDKVFENAEASLINTREKRYNNIQFSSEILDGEYILKSQEGILRLDIIDEIILYIITKFRFCPSWLVNNWYTGNDLSPGFTIGDDLTSTNKIRQFIDFGLLYELTSPVSVFLMPTERLATLFNTKLGQFCNPPYNTLVHTICEEQVMFDCMSGNSKYIQDLGINCIPYISSLGLGKLNSGAFTIPESDYSMRMSTFKNNIKELNDAEATLAQEMLNNCIITTPDFKENNLIVYKKMDVNKYELKIPDLAILAPRQIINNIAMPKSIAIEIELTAKPQKKYDLMADVYWSNLKYGYVIYLTNDKKIKTRVEKAINKISKEKEGKEDKTCNFIIKEFQMPYNKKQLF